MDKNLLVFVHTLTTLIHTLPTLRRDRSVIDQTSQQQNLKCVSQHDVPSLNLETVD